MKFVLLTLALSLSACAPVASSPQPSPQPSQQPPAKLFLSAERVASGNVRLTLDNGTPQPVGYNLCSSELQRLTSSGWMRVETDEVCTMELRTLNPGHDATFEKRLPAAIPAGEYRYVAGVESPLGGSRVNVATARFRVGA